MCAFLSTYECVCACFSFLVLFFLCLQFTHSPLAFYLSANVALIQGMTEKRRRRRRIPTISKRIKKTDFLHFIAIFSTNNLIYPNALTPSLVNIYISQIDLENFVHFSIMQCSSFTTFYSVFFVDWEKKNIDSSDNKQFLFNKIFGAFIHLLLLF